MAWVWQGFIEGAVASRTHRLWLLCRSIRLAMKESISGTVAFGSL